MSEFGAEGVRVLESYAVRVLGLDANWEREA